MTRRIRLITAVAGLGLVVAVPVASGEGQRPAIDPATVAQQVRGVALDRHYGLGRFAMDPATIAQELRGDALDRHYGLGMFATDPATVAQQLRGDALDRHYRLGRYTGLDPASGPTSTVATTSGRDLEWPQIGVAFGIGIALMLGVFLALRLMHIRPLAH